MVKRIDRPGFYSRNKSTAHFQRQERIFELILCRGMSEEEARAYLRERTKHYRDKPLPFEPCHARNRRGEPCQARALENGRCRCHGGLSRGQTTEAGRLKALENLHRWWNRNR